MSAIWRPELRVAAVVDVAAAVAVASCCCCCLMVAELAASLSIYARHRSSRSQAAATSTSNDDLENASAFVGSYEISKFCLQPVDTHTAEMYLTDESVSKNIYWRFLQSFQLEFLRLPNESS